MIESRLEVIEQRGGVGLGVDVPGVAVGAVFVDVELGRAPEAGADAFEVFEGDALIGAAMREAERVVVLRRVLGGLHIAQIDAVDETADQPDAGSQGGGGPGGQDGAARDLLHDEVGQRGEGGVGEDAAHGVFAPAGHQGDCAAVGVAVQEDRAGRSATLADGVVDRA